MQPPAEIQTRYTRQSLALTPPSDQSEAVHPAGALAPRTDAVAAVDLHPVELTRHVRREIETESLCVRVCVLT